MAKKSEGDGPSKRTIICEGPDDIGFFYEEHSCPTNWLRQCASVIEDGDNDPHGFLKFVRSVDVSGDFDEDDDEQWPMMFPEAFGGDVIDGECASVNDVLRLA